MPGQFSSRHVVVIITGCDNVSFVDSANVLRRVLSASLTQQLYKSLLIQRLVVGFKKKIQYCNHIFYSVDFKILLESRSGNVQSALNNRLCAFLHIVATPKLFQSNFYTMTETSTYSYHYPVDWMPELKRRRDDIVKMQR